MKASSGIIMFAALCAALVALATIESPLSAADARWTGTWKLDVAKSTFKIDTFHIASVAGAKYSFSDSPAPYSFACDGRATPTGVPGNTIVCKKTAAKVFDVLFATRGTPVDHETLTIDAAGKGLTLVDLQLHADGSKSKSIETYARDAASGDLAGVWKNTKVQLPDTLLTLKANPNSITTYFTSDRAKVDMKLDGSPSPFVGPNFPAKTFMVAKAIDATSFSYLTTINGKAYGEGIFKLAADGKSIAWTSWTSGKRSGASTAVYVRQ